MRYVIKKDRNGYLRRWLVRDQDGDELAEQGIPAGPPDIEQIDWEYVKREINNALVENGLFTWDDVQRSSIGFNVACSLVKRSLSGLFHKQDRDVKEAKNNQ